MASVRDTLLAMLTQYPSLFKNKTDCFRHLFLTNGNGYDWVDGELVSICDAKSVPDFKDENEEILRRTKDDLYKSESFNNQIRLDVRRNNMLIQFALDNIDLIVEEHLMFYSGSSISYSGWNYSLLMQVPLDIKPDWEKAVRDCMWALTPYINQSLRFDGYHLDGVKMLEQDLIRLKKERFPDILETDKNMSKILSDILAKSKGD